jgi:hypothetical protein
MENKINYIITEIIKNNQMSKYKFVYPETRNKLKNGDIIKYIDLNYKTNNKKIITGILIKFNINKLFLKSLDNKFFWSIKINNNYIFYYRPYFDLLENLDMN